MSPPHPSGPPAQPDRDQPVDGVRRDSSAVLPAGLRRWSRSEIEVAIGEPLMVPDPLLSKVQAAELLAVTVAYVKRLAAAGRLTAHGRGTSSRRFRLSELEQVDLTQPLPPLSSRPRPSRRRGAEGQRARPAYAAHRVSLREAAEIIGLTPATLLRHYAGTDELPRLPGAHYVFAVRDANELARRHAARLSVPEAAQRLGTTRAVITDLLRTGQLPRIPDRRRPVREDHLKQLLETGWRPPRDPTHDGRIPTRQAAQLLGTSTTAITEQARLGQLPAVRDRRGRWWFRPDHLTAIQRARRSQELRDIVSHDTGGCPFDART